MNISSSFDEQTKELIDYMAKKINVNDMNSQIADCYLFDSNEGLISIDEVGNLSDYELIFMSDGLILTNSESLGDAFYNFDNQQDVQFELFSFHNVSYLNNILESEGFDSIDTVISSVAKEEGKVSGKTAFAAAKQGDKAGQEVVDKYIGYITCGLLNLVNIFCPDAILIGGGISYEKEYLTAPIQSAVNEKRFGAAFNPYVEVKTASLKNDAGILGAAALVIQEEV